MDHQGTLNRHLLDAIAEFRADYPDATDEEIMRGVKDTLTDVAEPLYDVPNKFGPDMRQIGIYARDEMFLKEKIVRKDEAVNRLMKENAEMRKELGR